MICGLGSPGDGVEYRSKLGLNEGNAADGTEENSNNNGVTAGGVVGIMLMLALPIVVWALYTRHCSDSNDKNDSGPAEIYLRDNHLYSTDNQQHSDPAMFNEPTSTTEGGEPSERGVGELEGKDDDGSCSMASMVSDSHIGDVHESFTHIGDVNETFDTSVVDVDEDMMDSHGEIRELVEETAVVKSADELLEAYAGRENELLAYLKKMKTERRVKELVDELKPGRTSSELLSEYSGREAELISHLEKMVREKARPGAPSRGTVEGHVVDGTVEEHVIDEIDWSEVSTSASMDNTYRREVDSLVRELRINRTTDELMNEYAGRGDELLAHLRKLKSSTS